jgi:hypothetical protein
VTCVGGEQWRRSGAGGNGAHRQGAHLKGREVRGGRGLLEELGGGVEEPRPSAHLRVTPASAATTADAGHRRRGRRVSLVVSGAEASGAALELWGFWSAEGRSGGAFCEMAAGLGSRASSFSSATAGLGWDDGGRERERERWTVGLDVRHILAQSHEASIVKRGTLRATVRSLSIWSISDQVVLPSARISLFLF